MSYKFKIIKNYATLSGKEGGWTKELNLVAWNDCEPAVEIRSWGPDHEKMSKGIKLTQEELKALKKALEKMPEAE